MPAITLTRDSNVHILTLSNPEKDNCFNIDVLAEYNAVLDEIEAGREDASLLIRSDHPKTFCNGIDLPWLMSQQGDVMKTFVLTLENFLIRLSLLNLPVVAAINGNAYAGGALMANCCDFRLMRADRGRMCYSEISIKMAFTPVMFEVVRLQANPHAAWEMTMTGRAMGGDECARRLVVDRALPINTLNEEALKLAAELATKHRGTYTQLKRGLRPAMVALARDRGLLQN